MSGKLASTPAEDGYRMPAEWEPHEGCWMVWPERPDNWRNGAKPAQCSFAAVANAIADAGGEPVTVGASQRQFRHARKVLHPDIRVVEMTTNDAWARDIGPTFVIDSRGGRRGVDWSFNAWGGLYSPWDDDHLFARKVLEIERADRYRAPLVLEGGAIHTDGEGTVITTEQCLLSPGRNPGLSREQIEQSLCEYLGAQKVIWLGQGVCEDDTAGHVDNLACFAAPGVVCLTWTDDEDDPQHAVSADALERLQAATDARGRRLRVHRIPMPGPLHYTDQELASVDRVYDGVSYRHRRRMPASYVNFYIANRAVIVPLLDERTDAAACAAIAELFPDRDVVGMPAREILLGGGNVHCITQQVPAHS